MFRNNTYSFLQGISGSRKSQALLALRLLTLVLMVTMLTMHARSLRLFRWEQWVSGGILVTYCIAVLGLALCAGADTCGGTAFQVGFIL